MMERRGHNRSGFHRDNAAGATALAAAGQGSDADKLDDTERTRVP
jgi:hypothetical protein